MSRLLLDYLAFVDDYRDILQQFATSSPHDTITFSIHYDAISNQIYIQWNNDGKQVHTRMKSHQMFISSRNNLVTIIKTLATKKQINERI